MQRQNLFFFWLPARERMMMTRRSDRCHFCVKSHKEAVFYENYSAEAKKIFPSRFTLKYAKISFISLTTITSHTQHGRSGIDAFLVRMPDLVSRLCGDESEGWHSSRHFSRVFVHFEAFYRLSSRRLCALSFHLPAVPAIRFEL